MSQHHLRQFIRMVLIEGKLDDLKSANPDHASTLDSVAKIGTKYLDWSVKQLKKGASPNDLIPTLEFFHGNIQRFEKKDIGAYSTLSELEDAVKSLPEKSKTKAKSEAKAEGADKLFEDERFILLYIKNKDAAICYGSSTQWCITMRDASYFERYTDSNVVFYFVIDKKSVNNRLSKVAFAVMRDEKNSIEAVEVYDAVDKQIKCPASMKGLLVKAKADAPQRPMSKMMKLKSGLLPNDEMRSMMNDKDANIRAQVARFIDPEYLPQMLDDDEGFIRAIVLDRIDPKYLSQMMNDEYAHVRFEVARRIDVKYLPQMIHDSDWVVRIEVAQRIDPEHLPQMIDDDKWQVRIAVAKRIDSKYLPQMMNDEGDGVRVEVARRIDVKSLPQMMNDEYAHVRFEVAKRIDPEHLPQMMNDRYWNVRFEVAKRIDPKYLPQMAKDDSLFVRDVVDERLKQGD